MPLDRTLEKELRNVPGDYEREFADTQIALEKHDEKVQERSWLDRIWHAREDRLDRNELVKELEHWREHADVAWDVTRKLQPIIEREVNTHNRERAGTVQELERFDDALTRTTRMAEQHIDRFDEGLTRITNEIDRVRDHLSPSMREAGEIVLDARYQLKHDREELARLQQSNEYVREPQREASLRELAHECILGAAGLAPVTQLNLAEEHHRNSKDRNDWDLER
jgi:hypothetical protein